MMDATALHMQQGDEEHHSSPDVRRWEVEGNGAVALLPTIHQFSLLPVHILSLSSSVDFLGRLHFSETDSLSSLCLSVITISSCYPQYVPATGQEPS